MATWTRYALLSVGPSYALLAVSHSPRTSQGCLIVQRNAPTSPHAVVERSCRLK